MISLIQNFEAGSVEGQPQNLEFRNNPKNVHPCTHKIHVKKEIHQLEQSCIMQHDASLHCQSIVMYGRCSKISNTSWLQKKSRQNRAEQRQPDHSLPCLLFCHVFCELQPDNQHYI